MKKLIYTSLLLLSAVIGMGQSFQRSVLSSFGTSGNFSSTLGEAFVGNAFGTTGGLRVGFQQGIESVCLAQVGIARDTTFCTGDSARLSSVYISGLSFKWLRNGIVIAGATDSVFFPKTTGQYKLVVYSANCSDTSRAITITAKSNPTVTIPDSTKICGTTTTLDAGSGTGAMYAWSTGASSRTLAVTTAGKYFVTKTQNGCSVQDSTYVDFLSVNVGNDTSICSGNSITLGATVNGSAAAASLPANLRQGLVGYWPFNGNANDESGNGNNGTVNGATLAADRFGNSGKAYAFDGVSSNIEIPHSNSIAIQNSITISGWFYRNNFQPNNSTLISKGVQGQYWNYGTSIDNNNRISYNYTHYGIGVLNPISIQNWQFFSISIDQNLNKMKLFLNGRFFDTLYNVNTNSVESNFTNIINSCCNASLAFGKNSNGQAFFNGKLDDILIHNRALSNAEIQQIYNQGQNTYLWSTGSTTPTINVNPTQTTTYYCTVSNGITTCTDSVVVTVNKPPTPTISASGNTAICNGDSVVLTSSALTGNTWSNGSTARSITVKTSGSFKVLNTTNGCKSDSSLATVVTVNAKPATPTISASSNTTFCSGDSVVLTSSSTSGNTWSNGSTARSITVKTSGSFKVLRTTNGCKSDSSLATVVTVNTKPATPTISASTNTTFCSGDSVILTSSATSGNTWSNGSSSRSITVKTSGSFKVLNTTNGCKSDSSLATVVTVNPKPATPTISASTNTTFCSGDSVILTSSATSGNTWSNGSTARSITVKTSGSFKVLNTTNGCKSDSSLATVVTVNTKPATPTISASSNTTFCSGDSVVLTSSATSGNTWSNGSTARSITVKTSGSFKVLNTTNGCKSDSSLSTVVTVNAKPATPTISASTNTTFCSGDSVILTSSALTGNIWNNGSTARSITVKLSGSFKVVASANGCISDSSLPTVVTVNAKPATPTISASSNTTFCSGDSVVLTSSATSGNAWSNGSIARSITVKTSGSFKVLNTTNGCKSDSSLATVVTVNAKPATPTISASSNTTFCSGDSVILTSSATSGNTWSNGSSSRSITVKTSGSFKVLNTTNGCKSDSSLATVVTVNAKPATPTISASSNTTFCSGDSVILTSSALTGNTWSNSSTARSITVKTSGSFKVLNTTNGCKSDSSLATVVTVNAKPTTPTISASTNTTFCSGDSVILTSSATSGNTWSNGSTARSITVKTSGSFKVLRTTNGCTSDSSLATVVTVNAKPATPTISASSNTTFCSGDSVILTSSATSGNTWSNGSSSRSITVKTSGSFKVLRTTNGCTSDSSLATVVTVNTKPATPTISASSNTTFCSGDSVILTSSATSGNAWSNGSIARSITVKTSGSFKVLNTTNGCKSDSSLATVVTVNAKPATPTISASTNTTFCSGDSVILTSSALTGNTWSNGSSSNSIVVKASGSFNVLASANGCSSDSSLATVVTVNAKPATPTISASSNTTFCSGDSVILTSSATAGNIWNNGSSSNSIVVKASGSFKVLASANGCSSDSSLATVVTVNAKPATPTISASTNTTFCSGDSVVLTSSAVSGNTWNNGSIGNSIVVKASGSFKVLASANGCSSDSSLATVVTVNAKPATPTISASTNTTFCSGDSVILTSSATSGNTWSNGSTSNSIVVKASGSFKVLASANGCSSDSSLATVVTVNAKPATPTISASTNTTFCSGDSVVLTSTATAGNTWSNGSTSNSIVVKVSGSFKVLASANGCTSDSSLATVVTVNAKPATPTISASSNTTFCSGDSVILTSSATAGNIWNNGSTSNSIVVKASGSFKVLASANGCTSDSSLATVVTVNAKPATPTISASTNTTFCSGDSVILTSSATAGNTWNNGSTSNSIVVKASGSFKVLASANGCSSDSSLATVVTVNTKPATPTISASGNTTFCSGDSVILTSSAVSGNTWNNGSTSNSIVVKASGSFNVSASANGCSSDSSLATVVNVNAKPATPTISASSNTTFCSGDSVILTSSAIAGNTWNNGFTGNSIVVKASGSFNVLASANGCSSDSSLATVVTVNAKPATPTISASGNTTFCSGDSVILTSSALTGNTWSNGSSANSIVVKSAGTFKVMAVVNGCKSDSSVATITRVNPLPPKPIVTRYMKQIISNGSGPFQWYLNGVPVNGATNAAITLNNNGKYTVRITNAFGCGIFSDTIEVKNIVCKDETKLLNEYSIETLDPLGISGLSDMQNWDFNVYPNPSKGHIQLKMSYDFGKPNCLLTITDLSGRIIVKRPSYFLNGTVNELDFSELKSGLYYLQIERDGLGKSKPISIFH